MAEFLRPQIREALWRWREVAGAAALALLGLYWALTSFVTLKFLGVALTILGLGLVFSAVQRLRFSQGGGGPGLVQVDEGKITYFGPLTGGSVDLDDLMGIVLDPTSRPMAHWVLIGADGLQLSIPVNAEGAEALFDVFTSLPGLQTRQVMDVLSREPEMQVLIWQRGVPRLK